MPQFLKTNNIGHAHIVYIVDETQPARVSFDDGHTHDVMFDPNIGQFVVGFAPNGHSHILEDVPMSDVFTETGKDNDIVQEVWDTFRGWAEQEQESREQARIAENFYWGEQWEDTLRSSLERQGRACLTINTLERQVDGICGEQRQERTDLKFYPQESGDQKVADILNHVVKYVLENCFFHREESKAFEDQVIVGRGNLNIWIDDSNDIQGEIKVEKYNWDEVVYAPHEKEDLEDCEGLIKHKLFSRAKLKALYPEFAEQISTLFTSSLSSPMDTTSLVPDYDTGYYKYVGGFPQYIGEYTSLDNVRKDLRVVECWRKIYNKTYTIIDTANNQLIPTQMWKDGTLQGWSFTDVNKVTTMEGLIVKEHIQTKIRITKICGNILLSDKYPAQLPSDDLFMIPIYAKKRGSKWKGKVISGIDSQREINHRHSQAVDIGNRTAGYGWFYDDTTFASERDRKNFEDYSSTPGFKLKISDQNRPPLKIEGGKFPSEIVQLMQMADSALTATLSLEVGQGGANESAAHLMERKKARMLPNEFLFDNLSFAKKKLGKLLIKTIQYFYTPERILRILQSNAATPDMQVGGQPLANYSYQELLTILQTSDLTKYDIEVAESGYSPTARMATFMLLSDMAKSGAPVPPELMIEFMDIPSELKTKIQDSMMQQSQAAQGQQQANSDMEINKTLIAQGIIPPKIQEQLQAQQPQMPQSQEPMPEQGANNLS